MAYIEAKDYRFYYPGQIKPALDISNCSVERGTICLIAGPSGSGKSTLLRQFAKEWGLRGREEGKLHVEASEIAYVWQNPENQIVTDSVSYELVFGQENAGVSTEQMKRRLAEVVTAFGLESLVERDTMELSGGEKQIVNVASCLAMNPELMILDEPTGQLDPVASRRLYDLLRQINEELGVTIVLAEQRLEDIVPIADSIICMEGGRIVAQGAPGSVYQSVRGSACEQFFPSYMKLGENLLTRKEARIWFESHYQSLEFCDENMSVKRKPSSDYLILKDIYFLYTRKGMDILAACSGMFSKGRITCLAGGNGSGKTTLLRLLAGQLRAYHGKLKSAESVSYLPQNPEFIFLEETVNEESKKMTDIGKKLMKRFGLSDLKEQHPSDLSGGEKQRLALCHVLGKEADCYLLDEPTKGLDASSKEIFGLILKEWTKAGKTILMVSHDMEFAACHTEEMALLYHGEIVLQSETRDFFEENQFYTTGINRVARRVNSHIITLEDVKKYAKRND